MFLHLFLGFRKPLGMVSKAHKYSLMRHIGMSHYEDTRIDVGQTIIGHSDAHVAHNHWSWSSSSSSSLVGKQMGGDTSSHDSQRTSTRSKKEWGDGWDGMGWDANI